MARAVSRDDRRRSQARRAEISGAGESGDVDLSAGGGVSDNFRAAAPPPGPPRPYHFPHIERRSLPNGLKVLVAENHNAPVVAVRALISSGADHDTQQLAGLASMTAELLDEGAGSRDAIRLAEDLGLLG